MGFIEEKNAPGVFVTIGSTSDRQCAITGQGGEFLVERRIPGQRTMRRCERECAGQDECNRLTLFVINFAYGIGLTRNGTVEYISIDRSDETGSERRITVGMRVVDDHGTNDIDTIICSFSGLCGG